MKIDGKKPADMSGGRHDAVANANGSEGPAAPKLQARPKNAARLIHENECTGSTATTADVNAKSMRWVSFEALYNPHAADFPYTNRGTEFLWTHGLGRNENRKSQLFDERTCDERIVDQRRTNVARHFTNTWPSRLPSQQQQQIERGRYYLTDLSSRSRHCRDYPDFANFVGAGQTGDLPERILHAAGPQLHNFLCQTYLYNPALSLFGHVGLRRVEPMPNLRTVFDITRNQRGQVQARYAACDDRLDRAMLVGTEDYDEHEASALAPASIRFSGTLLFSPDGYCAIGPVRIHATAMQFAEPTDLAVTDSFA